MIKNNITLVIILSLVITILLCITACDGSILRGGKQMIDTSPTFDYVYVNTFNGVIEGVVEAWNDWEDSDMVQVVIEGKTYYTHGSNIVLLNN